MADNEQIRQQNEINRATGHGHDAAKRETAGMIEKLRKAVGKLLRVLPDAEIEVAREGWGNTNTRLVLDSVAELRAALAGSETPAKDAWAEGNAMLKKIGEPTADRNAGMVEKLREALRWALGALQDCARYRRDGRQFCCFCNTATESPDGFQCPKSCPYQQAHRTLAESEAGVDTFVLPAHETILTSTGAEQVRPTSFVPTECPIPPTTPEEVNDILASVGLPPRPLPPPEIAQGIVEMGNERQTVRICGCDWGEIHRTLQRLDDFGIPICSGPGYTGRLTLDERLDRLLRQRPCKHLSAVSGLTYLEEDDMPPRITPSEVAEIQAAAYEGRIAELEAVVQKERKAASEAKLSVTKYAGRRIAELERQLQRYRIEESARIEVQKCQWERISELEVSVAGLKGYLKGCLNSLPGDGVLPVRIERAKHRIAELEDDLKLQRQANKFNHDEHQQEKAELERQLQLERAKPDRDKQWREKALTIIAEQKRQLSPAPCSVKGHRQVDLVPERRKARPKTVLEVAIFADQARRVSSLGPPCGHCIEVEKARSEALEEAIKLVDEWNGPHPSEVFTIEDLKAAIRGSGGGK